MRWAVHIPSSQMPLKLKEIWETLTMKSDRNSWTLARYGMARWIAECVVRGSYTDRGLAQDTSLSESLHVRVIKGEFVKQPTYPATSHGQQQYCVWELAEVDKPIW